MRKKIKNGVIEQKYLIQKITGSGSVFIPFI